MLCYLFQPKQIHLSSKTGIPLHVLPKKGLTAKQVERMQMINSSDLPKVSTQPRLKTESKEDKKARKQAIKEERKVALPDEGLAGSYWEGVVEGCQDVTLFHPRSCLITCSAFISLNPACYSSIPKVGTDKPSQSDRMGHVRQN